MGREGFAIQPADSNFGIEDEHFVVRVPLRQPTEKLEDVVKIKKPVREKRDVMGSNKTGLTGDEDMFTWYEVR